MAVKSATGRIVKRFKESIWREWLLNHDRLIGGSEENESMKCASYNTSFSNSYAIRDDFQNA
jgi:hypothetical protein